MTADNQWYNFHKYEESVEKETDFDENGDYILKADNLPKDSKQHLPKYWMGLFNPEEEDRLTPEEHKKISSE